LALERMLTSANLRDGLIFTCAADGSMDMRTLVGCRFVELRKFLSFGIGVGSEIEVEGQSQRYFCQTMQKVTVGAAGFLSRDNALLDETNEVDAASKERTNE